MREAMACQLTFLDGARQGSTLRLEQDEILLGRDPRCTVTFDPESDLLVSGRHARIERSAGAFLLSDSSSNGTFVNGQRVAQVELRPGDVIELGQGGPRVRFDLSQASAGEGESPATRQAAPAADAVAAFPELIFQRADNGQQLQFQQPLVRIGRDPGSDIAFDPQRDLLVSQSHAKVAIIGEEVVLFDLESTNGTFCDGRQVTRLSLSGGETLEIGRGGPRLRLLSIVRPAATPAAASAAATLFGGAAVTLSAIGADEGEEVGQVALEQDGQWVIGRSGADVELDSMYVSKRHATLVRRDGQLVVRDHSVNGTFVDGVRVEQQNLREGAQLAIGPFLLRHRAGRLRIYDTRTRSWIDAIELSRLDRRSGHAFLDRVSLRIPPAEFVCVLGPSGCGKSTLLRSLSGTPRADRGAVLLNNLDFYANYERLKHQVGFVPQDDIIHPQLSVEKTLRYAARLRLPTDVGRDRRRSRIDDVLSMLELQDHRRKAVRELSGGQRKRVSIAVELLTEPAVIFLDEPTSGLDPNLEEKLMLLLRELTLRGKTVVAVTHTLDNIHLADKVCFLVDGKLVFYGTPQEGRQFFSVERLPDVYKRFDAEHDAETLRSAFLSSEIYQQRVASQLATPARDAGEGRPRRRRRRGMGPGGLRQLVVLVRRYLETITRDLRNTLILLLQAPLIALFIVAAVQTDQPERGPTSTMFMIMSLSALWFGCSNAARELTKEAAIYRRERMVNLRILSYVASKVLVLQFLALLQVTTMLLIVSAARGGYQLPAADVPHDCARYGVEACRTLILGGVPGSFGLHLLNLYLTALNGIGLGLLVSALVNNSDKAMSLVPLVLIPQVLFSGSFGIAKADEPIKRAVGYAMALNWSLDQAKRVAICTPDEERGPAGCTRCLHGYDPFKHQRLADAIDQEGDGRCQAVVDLMPAMIDFPETLELVEDGLYTPAALHQRGPPRQAHPTRRGLIVLGGYALLLFVLVCLFVRLKERRRR